MVTFEEIIKKAKSLSLAESEKSQIRDVILNKVKIKAVRLKPEKRLIFRLAFSKITLSFLIIIIAGAGIAGAENSLPGDLLYPIKTEINEKVRERLAISETAKTGYETGRIERRLEESEQLMLKGSIDKAAENLAKENLTQKIDFIKNKLETVKNEDGLEKAEEITSRIETVINAHESVIENILENKKIRSGNLKEDAVNTAISAIKTEIGASKSEAKKLREKTEKEGIEMGVFAKKTKPEKNQLENSLNKTKKDITQIRDTLKKADFKKETRIGLEKRISDTETDLADIKAKINAEENQDTFLHLKKTARTTEEIKIFIERMEKLNIDDSTDEVIKENRADKNDN